MAGGTKQTPADEAGDSARDRELSDAREQAVATEEILLALARAAADPAEILDKIVDRATRLSRADAGMIFLRQGEVFQLSRSSEATPEAYRRWVVDHPVERGRTSLVGRVVDDMRTQQLADVLGDAEYGRQDLQRLAGYRTLLAAPMMLGDEVVGALSMWRNAVAPFSDHEMRMLDDFAAQAAVALRQVELMRSLESRGADLATKVQQVEVLREVGEVVSSTLDPNEVLDRIVTNAVRLTGTDGGSIMEYDDQADAFLVRAAFGSSAQLLDRLRRTAIPRSTTLVGRAVTQRRPLQVADVSEAPADAHLEVLRQDGWRSVLAVPMVRGDLIVGVLVIRRRSVGEFPSEMVELLRTFASQSSIAIVNARLFQELEAKSAELAVASRHKSEFLASMSHELRTPLNAVIGFSEVLLDRLFGELNDRQDEYVRDIWNSGRHLLELLNEILDLSKVEAGQMVLDPTTFRVSAALEYTLSLVRERAAQHGIALSLEVADDVTTIVADELRFKQVILNLVSNAVKFTPDGGRVDVNARSDAGELLVTVSDTGAGIPEQDRERIFESFQQGGRDVGRSEGTGLGLTLCRRIMDLFGGRLWLETELGVGSTFGVAFPTVPRVHVDRVATGPTDPTRPTVLLVDDDRSSLDLMAAYLEDTSARLEQARDGTEAIRLAQALRPDVVVLDIRLPGVDGWQVMTALRADVTTVDIPIVVTTVVDDRARGLALGAQEYLLKPVRREDLLGALARVGVPRAPEDEPLGPGSP